MILKFLKDLIRGAIGTYVIADKLEAIGNRLSANSLSANRIVELERRMAELQGRLDTQTAEFQGRLDTQAVEFQGRLDTQTAEFQGRLDTQTAEGLARFARGEAETIGIVNRAISSVVDRTEASGMVQEAMRLLRAEYTVLPRFGFHQPLDYLMDSAPPQFEPPIYVTGEDLPLPPIPERHGYPADDAEYLASGRYDADLFRTLIHRHLQTNGTPLAIMDFGCATGRVLRHFYADYITQGWQLYGVDVQARCIEWLRLTFPTEFIVYTGTVLPTLPFPDNSLDVIYGVSVFSHTKYLWDMWLLELRRVLRPGGLLLQSIHAEHAWESYYKHRNEDWVRNALPPRVYNTPTMDLDWFHSGDISVSQAFWKRETARTFWGKYFDIINIMPPPAESHWSQDLMICRKSIGGAVA